MVSIQDKASQFVGDIYPTHWRRIANALEIYLQEIGKLLPTDWQRISNVQQIYIVHEERMNDTRFRSIREISKKVFV